MQILLLQLIVIMILYLFFMVKISFESKEISIGPKPNDLLMYEHKIYVVCGESNSMVI